MKSDSASFVECILLERNINVKDVNITHNPEVIYIRL